MRTAVLTLCALMPAGGQEIFVRRWDKPAAPRTDRRKALWNELGDLNSSQLRRQAYFAEVALNKCKEDLKKANNKLKKYKDKAAKPTPRERIQADQNVRRWSNGDRADWGDKAQTPFYTVSEPTDEKLEQLCILFLEHTIGMSRNKRKKLFAKFVKTVWGGKAFLSMVHQFQAQMKTHPTKYIKYMTEHPHAFNASTFKALGEAEGREANARTPLPSKSGISYWADIFRKGCDRVFGVLESTVNHANDTFKVASWRTFFGVLVKFHRVVEKCAVPGAPRYQICICCDGAPTEKNKGLVSLGLRQCDPRICGDTPQSTKWLVPWLGIWGSENKANMEAAFLPHLQQMLADLEHGYEYDLDDGTRGILYFDLTIGVDMKCAWAGFEGRGGAMTAVKWPDLKVPVCDCTRHLGMPFGCGSSMCPWCGRGENDNCKRWSAYDPERVRKLRDEQLAELQESTGNDDPMDRVEDLTPNVPDIDAAGKKRGLRLTGNKQAKLAQLRRHCNIEMHPLGQLAGYVDRLEDEDVQLELSKFGVKKPPAGEQGRKALLRNCLRSADLIRRAELYLEFPEVTKQGLWGMDPERIVTDPLHATLRLHPKLFWYAFMAPLRDQDPNGLDPWKRLERAANMLRVTAGFDFHYKRLNESEIDEFGFQGGAL